MTDAERDALLLRLDERTKRIEQVQADHGGRLDRIDGKVDRALGIVQGQASGPRDHG